MAFLMKRGHLVLLLLLVMAGSSGCAALALAHEAMPTTAARAAKK